MSYFIDSCEDRYRQTPATRLKRLSDIASSVEVDVKIPIKRYFRSGFEMIRMADVYMQEKNLENAFILYSKFLTLFVEKMKHHPDYGGALPSDKKEIKSKSITAFSNAEKLKGILKQQYEKEYEKWQLQKKQEEELERLEREKQRQVEEENRKIEQERKRKEEEKRIKMLAELDRIKNLRIETDPGSNFDGNSLSDNITYDWGNLAGTPESPEKNNGVVSEAATIIQPTIPSRDLKPSTADVTSKPDTQVSSTPSIDRSTKPASSLWTCGATGGNGMQLRSVVVPSNLMPQFLKLAEQNTSRNAETCGILTGKMCQNRFTITHLVVPKQKGTPDSCTTENEEDIFEFQDQHDLITLGWIHTHPSQTSFMSSVDLHTHCSYQLMLPEAIAIVIAPKYNEIGIYSLTNDYGLNFIAKCQLSGFHPHPKEPPLYGESEHVQIDESAPILIEDLR